MFNVVEGDLLKAEETFLCHQCNCVTKRSKHLAKTVFTEFEYADIYSKRKEPSQPGTVVLCGNGVERRYVVNMLGQYYPGCKYPDSKKDGKQVRFENFKKCLEQMKFLKGDFAFPWRIGCGAAGGDWQIYLEALKEFEQDIKGNVKVYRLPRKNSNVSQPSLF